MSNLETQQSTIMPILPLHKFSSR